MTSHGPPLRASCFTLVSSPLAAGGSLGLDGADTRLARGGDDEREDGRGSECKDPHHLAGTGPGHNAIAWGNVHLVETLQRGEKVLVQVQGEVVVHQVEQLQRGE